MVSPPGSVNNALSNNAYTWQRQPQEATETGIRTTVRSDNHPPHVIARIAAIPVVSLLLDSLAENVYTCWPYALVKRLSSAVYTVAKPVRIVLSPLITCVDGIANLAVDSLLARYPGLILLQHEDMGVQHEDTGVQHEDTSVQREDSTGEVPDEVTAQVAGDATLQVTGDVVLHVPVNVTLQVPVNIALQVPSNAILPVPGNIGPQVPVQVSLQVPGNATLEVPTTSTLSSSSLQMSENALLSSAAIEWMRVNDGPHRVINSVHRQLTAFEGSSREMFREDVVFDAATNSLVPHIYQRLVRVTTDAPHEIFQRGFLPVYTDEDLSNYTAFNLEEYLHLASRTAPRIFVSTTRPSYIDGELHVWKPLTFVETIFEYEVYARGGIDVNRDNQFLAEQEISFPGGIRRESIRLAYEVCCRQIVAVWWNDGFDFSAVPDLPKPDIEDNVEEHHWAPIP